MKHLPADPARAARRRFLQAAAAFGLVAPTLVQAQAYPARPVKIIVPLPPGGGNDLIARELADRLQARWHVPVVVENKPGAGGNIGAEAVAKASADGYTLLLAANQIVMTPVLYKAPGFDLLKDFSAVALLGTTPLILVVPAELPVNSVAQLIAYARSHPGQLSYGSAGIGAPQHIAAEVFKSLTRTDIAHVPYKGAALVIPDLLSGRIQVFIGASSSLLPHIKSGKLKALAVADSRRHPLVPDLPTIEEGGVPGYQADTWYGVLAPAGVPDTVLTRLHRDINEAMAPAELKAKLAQSGIAVQTESRAAFDALLRADLVRWTKTIQDAAIKAE